MNTKTHVIFIHNIQLSQNKFNTTKFLDTLPRYRITFLEIQNVTDWSIFSQILNIQGHCIPQTLVEHDAVKPEFKADITEADTNTSMISLSMLNAG